MAKLTETFARTRYRLQTRRRLAKDEWSRDYWYERDGERIVPCRRCPKLDAKRERCGVPFGTPLRKCVTAATEAHLRMSRGALALEIGSYRRSFAKHVIEQFDGTWTGLEPRAPAGLPPRIGATCHGHAGAIPFADDTFDVAFGIQSFEHWEEPQPELPAPVSYGACLAEIWRVLKPGGSLYLDAPIHLHGHEMFVAGDVPRILALFDRTLWTNLIVERWRYEHAPLPRYPTPAADAAAVIRTYDAAAIRDLQRNASVWLL
ncbi:MAG TPA: methyltransferase domain-containing protein, partial [Gammaproteobacteria bacterium]|nr:methyltransferase domain-containing protein [Gammaproteobacteria bacterium]